MLTWKKLGRRRWVQVALGTLAAEYLRLVGATNRFTLEPSDIYQTVTPDLPVILAMWHGQHLLVPSLRRPSDRAKVLVSRHMDGEINAIAAERLGVGTIRGSGAAGGDFARKGGVSAFANMLEALDQGDSVAMTADVPKVARIAGLGIVKLAQMSGRPILPIACATSRRIVLRNWDRTAVNLPFGRAAAVAGDPILVPRDADEAALEAARCCVEERLNAATRRVYEIVDGNGQGQSRG